MFKSIKSKLIILPAMPLMVALYFMGASIVTRVSVVSEMETLISLSQFSIKTSALVHEVQKERGLTAGFVGSKGEKFVKELTAQRKTVDKGKKILTAALDSLKTDSLSIDLQSALKKTRDSMSGFENHRKMVDSLSINGKKALSYYTLNNALMIDVIGQVSKVNNDPQLIAQLIAYENFLRGKERAGIERAVMNRTFTINLFEPGALKRFGELVSEQNTYFNVFNSLATKDQIQFFKKNMSNPIVAVVQKMRDTAFEIGMLKNDSFGVDPSFWFKAMTEKINLMKEVEDKLSSDLNIQAMALKKEAKVALIVLGIVVLTVLCCVGCVVFFFIRSITNPINQVALGLTEGANQIASGSGQVSSSSQALADGASQQAAALEETSSSLEEMSSITANNAESATQADKLMKSANLVVKDANEAMIELTGAIDEIATASEDTQKIIKSIDEIAFQTNLLALNAAVEAARAGEAGAGFAVVADEVRNLAMSAANAANDTAAMIEETVKKVTEGSSLVATTNTAFSKVGESTNTVGKLLEEISGASKEQSEGITQINKAVNELDTVVQQNAASAEENASASEQMAAQSEQMKYLIEDLNTLIGKQR